MTDFKTEKDRFPFQLLALYVVFYMGQAILNNFMNIYFFDIGFTNADLGLMTTISVVFLLATQFFWGVISDKAKSKNVVVILLYALSILCLLLFYTTKNIILVMGIYTLFNIFYSPVQTLQDSLSLELLSNSKWDFGQVRMGGTVGYALCSLFVGYIVGERYGSIFGFMAGAMLVGIILIATLPAVKGERQKKEKVSYKLIFQNKALVCLIFFNLVYSLCTSIYYSYYPNYYRDVLGASSSYVGWLSFASAISEVPMLIFAGKIVKKYGYDKIMILGGLASCLRYFLLFLVKDVNAVLAVSLLHGMGFIGFHFCLIRFINENVPAKMRSTAQMVNSMISMVFSRVLFGYLSGWLCDIFGVGNMMLVISIFMFIGTVIFVIWYSAIQRNTRNTPQLPPLES